MPWGEQSQAHDKKIILHVFQLFQIEDSIS